MRWLALAALLAGCATSACWDEVDSPYTDERPTQPFHVELGPRMSEAWFADGAPTVLTVHNPTREVQLVHVVCEPSVEMHYIDRGHIEGYFCLAPRTEQRRLVEFMNIDALRRPVCHIADHWENECVPSR